MLGCTSSNFRYYCPTFWDKIPCCTKTKQINLIDIRNDLATQPSSLSHSVLMKFASLDLIPNYFKDSTAQIISMEILNEKLGHSLSAFETELWLSPIHREFLSKFEKNGDLQKHFEPSNTTLLTMPVYDNERNHVYLVAYVKVLESDNLLKLTIDSDSPAISAHSTNRSMEIKQEYLSLSDSNSFLEDLIPTDFPLQQHDSCYGLTIKHALNLHMYIENTPHDISKQELIEFCKKDLGNTLNLSSQDFSRETLACLAQLDPTAISKTINELGIRIFNAFKLDTATYFLETLFEKIPELPSSSLPFLIYTSEIYKKNVHKKEDTYYFIETSIKDIQTLQNSPKKIPLYYGLIFGLLMTIGREYKKVIYDDTEPNDNICCIAQIAYKEIQNMPKNIENYEKYHDDLTYALDYFLQNISIPDPAIQRTPNPSGLLDN